MGELEDGTTPQDYELACFINEFRLLFSDKDHHVKRFKLSAQILSTEEREGHLMAHLKLEANLTDACHRRNTTDIPNNFVAGFILAINQNPQNDRPATLSQFIRSYNQISSDLHRYTRTS